MSDTQSNDAQPLPDGTPDASPPPADWQPPPPDVHAPPAPSNGEPEPDLSGFRLEMGHIGDFFRHIKDWIEWRLSKS